MAISMCKLGMTILPTFLQSAYPLFDEVELTGGKYVLVI